MTLPTIRGELAAFALVALVVIAVTLLAALGYPIPDVLVTVALVAVGGGAGASVPRTAPAAAVDTVATS